MSAPTTTQSFTLEYVKTIGMISNVARGRGFLNPFAMARNVDGRIYVADGNLIRITICNFEEDYLGEFATWYGDGDGDQSEAVQSPRARDQTDRRHQAAQSVSRAV